jgi:hypothetical protein
MFALCQIQWCTLKVGERGCVHSITAETFNSAQLCSCCWSLSVLQQEKSELFRTLWNQLGSSARSELKLNVRMAAQLSQASRDPPIMVCLIMHMAAFSIDLFYNASI